MRGGSFLRIVGVSQARGRPLCSAPRRAYAVEKETMTDADITDVLRRDESTLSIGQNAIDYVDINRLGANHPCEDNYSVVRCGPSDSLLFGIFDGHGGRYCSQSVAKRLFDYCCSSLATRNVQGYNTFHPAQTELLESSVEELSTHPQHVEHVNRFLVDYVEHAKTEKMTVRSALQRAFVALDADLSMDALKDEYSEDWTREHRSKALRSVVSGTCACIAHIRGPHLHLANVGDSVAVLAVRQETDAGASWTARQLTQEHVVDNSLEVRRIRGEHPHSEMESVLKGGRLLGELMPLRSFGDIRYKWDRRLQESVVGPGFAPKASRTPPYLTSLPEVYYHRLTPTDKFLVIASDGLWECLSPDRVVRLLADHAAGKDAINPYEPAPGTDLEAAIMALRRRKLGEGKQPIDVNSATHLMRVAIGGANKSEQGSYLSASLSLPAGIAREARDDITITVIYFDKDYLADL